MDYCLVKEYWHEKKSKQLHLEFELGHVSTMSGSDIVLRLIIY